MDFVPPIFAQVPIGTDQRSDCTPPLPSRDFHGIVIRTPQVIRIRKGERPKLPICANYQLPTGPLLTGALVRVHVRSLDKAIPEPISAVVVEGVAEPLAPAPPPPDPALLAGDISNGLMNIDAQRYLPRALPPGHYELRISYGETLSNVERFEIAR